MCTNTHKLDHSFDANFTKNYVGTKWYGYHTFPIKMKSRKTEEVHAHAHSMINFVYKSNFLFGSSRICEPFILHSNDCSPTISRSSALLRRYLKSVTRVIFTVRTDKRKSFLKFFSYFRGEFEQGFPVKCENFFLCFFLELNNKLNHR